uniref:ADP/ATP translocase n=1 Tax=Arcella intermedia TaxID=1963864 RepID=A0A6B2LDC8_9EUKA
MLCGASAGAIVKTFVAPIDRLKILYETQTMFTTPDKLKYTTITKSIKVVKNESGLVGFWRGNTANLLRVIPNSAIKFSTFDLYKQALKELFQDDQAYLLRTICAAAMSGASEVLVTYPLDLIRTRMAVHAHYRGITDCVRSTYRNEGARGFYAGIGLSLMGVMPYVGISMTIYDSCKKYLLPRDAPMILKLFPGAVGAICAACVTFPIDVVRKRLQLQGSQSSKKLYHSGFDCAKQILAKEGPYGLYRGVSLQLLRSAPSTSLQLITYDFLKKLLHIENST